MINKEFYAKLKIFEGFVTGTKLSKSSLARLPLKDKLQKIRQQIAYMKDAANLTFHPRERASLQSRISQLTAAEKKVDTLLKKGVSPQRVSQAGWPTKY